MCVVSDRRDWLHMHVEASGQYELMCLPLLLLPPIRDGVYTWSFVLGLDCTAGEPGPAVLLLCLWWVRLQAFILLLGLADTSPEHKRIYLLRSKWTFSKTYHTLGHRESLNKKKKTDIPLHPVWPHRLKLDIVTMKQMTSRTHGRLSNYSPLTWTMCQERPRWKPNFLQLHANENTTYPSL